MLQSILGLAQALQSPGAGLSALQLRHLSEIESAALEALAETTAGRVRPGRLVFEQVVIRLDDALAGVLAELQPTAAAAGLQLDAESSGLLIVGDREQFEQMLLNLLRCALRSTPGGGRVRLRARRVGDAVQLSIAGTAIAIPRELTDAKRLAELMGGELDWMPEPAERTTVNVRLPAPATL